MKRELDKNVSRTDVYLGISGIDLQGQIIDLGRGIQLRPTFAHLFANEMLAFSPLATPNSSHPGPWTAVAANHGVDILAALFIPKEYSHNRLSNLLVGHTILSILRLWCDPQIALQVYTQLPLEAIKDQLTPETSERYVARLYQYRQRHLGIGLIRDTPLADSIGWVVSNWETAVDLRSSSTEFSLSIDVFDNAQCIPNTAMMLVSIWGALEAIFAPHKAELVFRVSSQLAAFLQPRGLSRLQKQREIVKLYNLRSAAAHGSPKHVDEDLIKTYELLRMAIVRMIELKLVPDKDKLEELLFIS